MILPPCLEKPGQGERRIMIEYNPRVWKSTRMIRGYTYIMRNSLRVTKEKLKGVTYKINDCMIYEKPYMQGDRLCYGWMKFDKQLEIYDAMEAGLVPNFRINVEEK